jgi:hypothetical protein
VHALDGLVVQRPVVEDAGLHRNGLHGEGVPPPRSRHIGDAHAIPDLAHVGTIPQTDDCAVVEAHLRTAEAQGGPAAGQVGGRVEEALRKVELVDIGGNCRWPAPNFLMVTQLDEAADVRAELQVGEDQQAVQVVGFSTRVAEAEEAHIARFHPLAQIRAQRKVFLRPERNVFELGVDVVRRSIGVHGRIVLVAEGRAGSRRGVRRHGRPCSRPEID